MSKSTLYVTGNGFDLRHGMLSNYVHFYNYIKAQETEFLKQMQEIYDIKDYKKDDSEDPNGEKEQQSKFWTDFEASLSDVETDNLLFKFSESAPDYENDNYGSADIETLESELYQKINIFHHKLLMVLADWISTLTYPQDRLFALPYNDIYLSFNYTNTLERLYRITPSNITYIHNKFDPEGSDLIIGHNYDVKEIASLKEPNYNKGTSNISTQKIKEYIDALKLEQWTNRGDKIIDEYIAQIYKDTKAIIKQNDEFFNKIGDISCIYILGHSLNDIDMPYFHKLNESVSSECLWNIVYYADNENRNRKTAISAMKVMGIDEERYRLLTWNEYDSHAGIHNTAKRQYISSQ